MAKPNRRKIRQQVEKMDNAWMEGAPEVKFMGISQSEMHDKMTAILVKEQKRADLLAQAEMIDDELDDDYTDIDQTRVNVGNGVRGNPDYGDDSPLYGAMGFIRKSDRASGLTRKTKTTAK